MMICRTLLVTFDAVEPDTGHRFLWGTLLDESTGTYPPENREKVGPVTNIEAGTAYTDGGAYTLSIEGPHVPE
jgi:hypothetical protein